MTPPCTITFVIPVRNDARRLARCLDSIAHLDYAPEHIDVVVIDDHSTDNSAAVARAAGALVCRPPRATTGELRNCGACRASSDLLAFIDADHTIAPGWARAAVAQLSRPGIGATGALCQAPDHGTWVQRAYDALRNRPSGCHEVEWLGSGNLVVRREIFEAIGGFDARLETCEDVDLCRRIRARGWRLVSDDRLANVHYGDPATLMSLFTGELWRGRGNLRVSLRPPLTPRNLVTVAIPLVELGAAVVGIAATPLIGPASLLAPVVVAGGFAAMRTARMLSRWRRIHPRDVMQAFVVAGTYDLARALALVVRARHQIRRPLAAPAGGVR